jgi:hypothetical protein
MEAHTVWPVVSRFLTEHSVLEVPPRWSVCHSLAPVKTEWCSSVEEHVCPILHSRHCDVLTLWLLWILCHVSKLCVHACVFCFVLFFILFFISRVDLKEWNCYVILCDSNLFPFLWYWGLNSGFHTARQALYHLNHSTSPVFVLGIFKIGSLKLFA